MKYLVIILSLSYGLTAMAQDPDTLFRRANDYYQHGNFEEAVSLYLKIDSLGYRSAALYYNTGNAFFRSNKLGKARLYYEKAALLSPNDDDISNNLSFTESLLSDRFDEVPDLFFMRWYKSVVSLFHPGTWSLFSIVLFLLAMSGFLVYIFIRKDRFRRTGFYTGIFLFIFSMLCLWFAYQRDRQINHPGTAIIMSPSITVKSAPRESGKDLFVLHEGTKVHVDNDLNGWNEIRISDGRKGWIPATGLENL